jgi:cob(I)alamin adenosyltransferase
MKIYTRGGDDGDTGLFGGPRVPKDDPRVEAYGTVDELAAALGCARAGSPPELIDGPLARVQGQLFRLGAELACAPGREAKLGVEPISAADVAWVERTIDEHDAALPALRAFVLPGGTPLAAALHLARTICRRAERRVLQATRIAPLRPDLIVYLNRLGDLCFVLARRANHVGAVGDVPWRADVEPAG